MSLWGNRKSVIPSGCGSVDAWVENVMSRFFGRGVENSEDTTPAAPLPEGHDSDNDDNNNENYVKRPLPLFRF